MRDYAIGVCGFPRCGSSMTMRMLHAGGIPPVSGSSPGSYELHGLDDFAQRAPQDLVGHAVKLLDYVQWYGTDALPSVPWRFIWLDRNGRQQALSMVKFTTFLLGMDVAADAASRFRLSYDRDKPAVLDALRGIGPVLSLRFEHVLADPALAGSVLADFCGADATAAAACVHRRTPECRPDMAVELAALGERSQARSQSVVQPS